MNWVPHVGVTELSAKISAVTRKMVALKTSNFQQFST
jgi:hypothetical protein